MKNKPIINKHEVFLQKTKIRVIKNIIFVIKENICDF